MGLTTPAEAVTADDVTAAMGAAVKASHDAGLDVLLGTLLPFEGASYYSSEGETTRQAINQWIRSNTDVEGVIDFDEAMRDPTAPGTLAAPYDAGDHLHPGDAGYAHMAKIVDISKLR